MKQNSDILWYPIKNFDTQFTKNGAYLPNDLKFLSWAMVQLPYVSMTLLDSASFVCWH